MHSWSHLFTSKNISLELPLCWPTCMGLTQGKFPDLFWKVFLKKKKKSATCNTFLKLMKMWKSVTNVGGFSFSLSADNKDIVGNFQIHQHFPLLERSGINGILITIIIISHHHQSLSSSFGQSDNFHVSANFSGVPYTATPER